MWLALALGLNFVQTSLHTGRRRARAGPAVEMFASLNEAVSQLTIAGGAARLRYKWDVGGGRVDDAVDRVLTVRDVGKVSTQ